MTDEYRAFLESKRSESSDQSEIEHAEIPHWKPPEKFPEEDHLEHHGVLGQKWGVRRYQNSDGTRINSEPRKKKEPEFNSKTLQFKKKAQKLTDEELERRNKRMQKEVLYNQLRSQLQPKTKAEKRKELMKTIFVATATTAAAAIVTQLYKKGAEFIINKASGGKINLSSKKK